MNGTLRLIRYAARQWRHLALIVFLTIAVSAAVALEPWPLKILVDHALGHGAVAEPLAGWSFADQRPATLIFWAAGASLALFALYSVFDVALSLSWTAAGQRMVYDLAADLFARLQRTSLAVHARRRVGDSLARLTGDTWCVFTVVEALLIAPVKHLFMLVSVGWIAWQLDAQLTLIALATAPALAASALYFGPRLKRRSLGQRHASAALMELVHQTLGSIPLVQVFGARARNVARFREVGGQVVRQSQEQQLEQQGYALAGGLSTTLGAAIVLFVGGIHVLEGALSAGSLLVFLAYMRTLNGAARGLMATHGTLKTVEASIDRVLEVLDADDEVRSAPDAAPLPAVIRGASGSVTFDNVTFGYERGRPVLDGVSLQVEVGETVALVGPTGAGKSTLVSLVPRFFDPWDGRVLIDGEDLRGVRLADVRARVGIVLQEPYLLPISVHDNIAYGRPGASRAEVEAAARAACAEPFIAALPEGYDTIIGERGTSLSGGERQRLAIARALLRDAPIQLLDEPTSALDAETEHELMTALERLARGRTTFIIAHRLSTVRRADRIVVLDEGRILEQGGHDELLAVSGVYARYHALQLERRSGEVA